MRFSTAPPVLATALTLFFLLLLTPCASAQVVLKPKGAPSLNLREKSVRADVLIEGGIARTEMEIVYKNEVPHQIEADFIYALPPETLVTYFAYWFKEEKVVARIVERERAAAIYQHITSRMRDPALIEMTGKRTFRARIFPVEGNADLRVQMVMVQALPANSRGITFELPIERERGHALESLDVSIRIRGGNGAVIHNNYGMPVAAEGDGRVLRLVGRNFRPQKHLRVLLERRARPLQAEIVAARSGGTDGFFTLCLSSDRARSNPRLEIAGIRTYDVHPARLPNLKANETVLVTGRYRGSGPATIRLRSGGETLTHEVRFDDRAEPNNVATKLWAAQQIERLSAVERNRERVIALSNRFNLPSKFTSWLAVPEEEMKLYRREKIQADLEVLGRRYADLFRRGREGTVEAHEIRSRIDRLAKEIGGNGEAVVASHLTETLWTQSQKIAQALAAGRSPATADQAAFDRLRRLMPDQATEALRRIVRSQYAGPQARRLVQESVLQGESAKTENMRRELERLARHAGMTPKEAILEAALYDIATLGRTAYEASRRSSGSDAVRERLERLESSLGMPPGESFRRAQRQALSNERHGRVRELLQEVEAGRPDSGKAQRLRAEVRALSEEIGEPLRLNDLIYLTRDHRETDRAVATFARGVLADPSAAAVLKARERLVALAGGMGIDPEDALAHLVILYNSHLIAPYVAEDNKTIRDREALARERAKVERLAATLGVAPSTVVERYLEQHAWAREQERQRLLEELREPVPDPERLRELERAFRERMGDFRTPEWREARIERIRVETELDRLQEETPTPEMEARREELRRRREELRARMGDPLVVSQAPADARHVVAVMPDGEVKRLEFNGLTRRWEARFDIPTYAKEGEYVVQVIAVLKDGTRTAETMRYHVDVTPPKGKLVARIVEGRVLRIELEADEDAARASAILPWGEQRTVGRTGTGRFLLLAPIPEAWQGRPLEVRVILLDRAHNRTELKGRAE
jgi:hypothetical protein